MSAITACDGESKVALYIIALILDQDPKALAEIRAGQYRADPALPQARNLLKYLVSVELGNGVKQTARDFGYLHHSGVTTANAVVEVWRDDVLADRAIAELAAAIRTISKFAAAVEESGNRDARAALYAMGQTVVEAA